MADVVLMNSGGLDSALVAKWLKDKRGHSVHSVYIKTGQVNEVVTEVAAQTTADRHCVSHRVITLDLGQTPNHWEVRGDVSAPVEMYDALTPAQRADYKANRAWQDFRQVPNQAMLNISIAVAYAKTLGIDDVYSGHRINVGREDWTDRYNEVSGANLLQVRRPNVRMPFSAVMTYLEAAKILLGVSTLTTAQKNALRTEFAYTYSCRWPTPCGVCDKCTSRATLGLT